MIGFFFNDFVVNVLAELADHCLLMFDSKNAKKAKSLPCMTDGIMCLR